MRAPAESTRPRRRGLVNAALLTLVAVVILLGLGTWQAVALVDLNVDNPDRQVRLSLIG